MTNYIKDIGNVISDGQKKIGGVITGESVLPDVGRISSEYVCEYIRIFTTWRRLNNLTNIRKCFIVKSDTTVKDMIDIIDDRYGEHFTRLLIGEDGFELPDNARVCDFSKDCVLNVRVEFNDSPKL